jgi:hypothetical protein
VAFADMSLPANPLASTPLARLSGTLQAAKQQVKRLDVAMLKQRGAFHRGFDCALRLRREALKHGRVRSRPRQ